MGGERVQNYTDMKRANYGSIPVGDCLATDAGSSHFRKIIHANGPRWPTNADEQNKAKNQLLSAIFNSLVCASVFGYTSLAVPTISDEYDKIPTEVAAKCYFNAVDKYV